MTLTFAHINYIVGMPTFVHFVYAKIETVEKAKTLWNTRVLAFNCPR